MATAVLNAKVGEVENDIYDHAEYNTVHKFKKLSAQHFAARLKQANLVSKI